MSDAPDLGQVPEELRTPFRDALAVNHVVAAAFISRKRLVTHLIRPSREAYCGVRRPTGEVSDMTKYAVEKDCCKRCVAAFHGDKSRIRIPLTDAATPPAIPEPQQ